MKDSPTIAGLVTTATVLVAGLAYGAYQFGQEHPDNPAPTVTKTVKPPVEHWEPESPAEPVIKPDVKFGETYRFGPEGLAFSVSKPKPITVKAKGQKYSKYISFTVKMANVSKQDWKIEQTLLDVYVDKYAANQYSGDFPQELAAGKTTEMHFIFNVYDYNNVVSVEIMPDFTAPITWG